MSHRAFLAFAASAVLAAGCWAGEDGGGGDLPGSKRKGESGGAGEITLTGAGATFPYPLYTKWVAEYGKAHPGVRINYQSIGSGGGIRQVTERTVDFGASDAPMTDEQIAKAGGMLHIPTCIGAVVLTYRLDGVPSGLRLAPEAIAGIFLGTVTKWNDPAIARDNPSAKLPDAPILTVHRSDGSGTTKVFADYLSAVSPAWKAGPGTGTSVRWPGGLGAKGNEGVAATLASTPGSIGYIELAYAAQNGLSYASVRNRAGRFVAPTIASTTAAAAGAATHVPSDLRTSIVDAPGDDAYPIAAFTYVLVRPTQSDAAKGRALVRFLEWALGPGQALAPPLHYAPLPPAIAAKARAKLTTVQGPNGTPLLAGK